MANSSLDLAKYINTKLVVKFSGGRQVSGILKGYDPLVNLVLEDAEEALRDPSDSTKLSGQTRKLGTLMCKGTAVTLISPEDGFGEIANPFVASGDS